MGGSSLEFLSPFVLRTAGGVFRPVNFSLALPQFIYFFFLFLFVVNFVIHWHETAMGLHVFPIPIPPPTSLSTRSP